MHISQSLVNVSHSPILTTQQHVAFGEQQAQQPFWRGAMTALLVGTRRIKIEYKPEGSFYAPYK
jgi:hypothetical protein